MDPAIGFEACTVENYGGIVAIAGDVRVRHFPLRVTDSLALIVDHGGAQVTVDGKRVCVPSDATIFRPPNAIWSIEPARFGFACINIEQRLLPRATRYEAFTWRRFSIAGLRTVEQIVEALFEAGLARGGERFSGEQNRVRRAREFIEAHFASNPDLAEIAAAAELDRFALVRLFRRAYGITPHAFQIRLRIREAERLLGKESSLERVAHAVGFADLSHLTRHFRRIVGVTPGAYRKLQFRSTRRRGVAVRQSDAVRFGSNHHE